VAHGPARPWGCYDVAEGRSNLFNRLTLSFICWRCCSIHCSRLSSMRDQLALSRCGFELAFELLLLFPNAAARLKFRVRSLILRGTGRPGTVDAPDSGTFGDRGAVG